MFAHDPSTFASHMEMLFWEYIVYSTLNDIELLPFTRFRLET